MIIGFCDYLIFLQPQECINNYLMTGPKGNSEFCFPETLNVPRGEAEGNIEVEGKQNSLFPEGQVIKCFVIPPNSKIENTTGKKGFVRAVVVPSCPAETTSPR